MAIRLGESIYHGKIDNSVKGVVTGEIVVEGFLDTLVLNLKGNCHPDLAGRILTFRNPSIEMLDPYVSEALIASQEGFVGEMTASKKRKFHTLSAEEFQKATPEEREAAYVWKNTLYLEWFSHYCGRIVIEAVDYHWEIDDARWELNDAEISAQVDQAAAAMNMHLNMAVELFQETNEEIRAEEAEIDPNANDEFAWEKRLAQSDRRADAFHALMEEARTPEEMEQLAELAYEDQDEEDFSEPDSEFSGGSDYVRDEYKPTREVSAVCKSIKKLCKSLIKEGYDEMIGLPEQGEFLSLMVKSQTVADMTMGDSGTGFERGFLIAHAKREIARSQRVVSGLTIFEQDGEPVPEVVPRLWELRDLLVNLAGKIRA
ncbi:MAG: hypothetical protein MI807_06050 [Verrucomicrobiales bacterium]|nr:hypothetical protein [Verrucomicrobiales bacterium]